MAGRAMRIGILALQGDFAEHRRVLEALGAEAADVRRLEDLRDIDGLVVPGGESTTIRLLMAGSGLDVALRERIAGGLPVMGTCAGLIVLAKRVDGAVVPGLNALDVSVRRNAFGRQVVSFEEDLSVPILGERAFRAVFIRAPLVESVEAHVQLFATLPDGRIVGVKQGAVLGLAFHPELTPDHRCHEYFLHMVAGCKEEGGPSASPGPPGPALGAKT